MCVSSCYVHAQRTPGCEDAADASTCASFAGFEAVMPATRRDRAGTSRHDVHCTQPCMGLCVDDVCTREDTFTGGYDGR